MYRTVYCGPNGVLIIKVPLYRTVYCGPNGVLLTEVSLYRTVYCGPNGVLIIEVPLHTVEYMSCDKLPNQWKPLYSRLRVGPDVDCYVCK